MSQSKKHSADTAQSRVDAQRDCSAVVPGQRYTKNGASVDVDFVQGGEVYVRLWPKGVQEQGMYDRTFRVPLADFLQQVEGATIERPNTNLSNAPAMKGGADE